MKRFFLITVIALILTSCSLDDDSNNFELKTLPIKEAEVPVEFIYGRTYDIMVTYDLPDGCHSFQSLFFQQNANERIVAINALQDLVSACTEAIIEENHTFELTALQEADYVFKFWKGVDENGDNIFEEVTVPVKESN
jgi:PBP1b-binding outer membrane lipoprotein LpoB